ncbi:hypothetical protein [Ammoniphilus sp. 3BR4]|uniref:hypothetical protein n=1 Tax=Ammoniphilus sp. 3BR4 TaxID=3158265 RepID=UPI0034652577
MAGIKEIQEAIEFVNKDETSDGISYSYKLKNTSPILIKHNAAYLTFDDQLLDLNSLYSTIESR